jgi:hypothetical protein
MTFGFVICFDNCELAWLIRWLEKSASSQYAPLYPRGRRIDGNTTNYGVAYNVAILLHDHPIFVLIYVGGNPSIPSNTLNDCNLYNKYT